MPQDDIDNGRLICRVDVAPPKPVKFELFRVGQNKGTERRWVCGRPIVSQNA